MDPTRDNTDLSAGELKDQTWVHSSAYVAQVVQGWANSLQSTYEVVLYYPGSSFYVCHQEWVFGCFSIGYTRFAFFNKTSLFLRKKLVQAGISFVHPLLEHEGEGAKSEADADSNSAAIDGSPSSLIVFSGAENLRNIIRFLVQSCLDSEKWLSVCPPILSRKPFLNASLQCLSSTSTYSKMLTPKGLVNVGTLVIQGVIIPENFKDLCSALRPAVSPSDGVTMTCHLLKQSEWTGAAMKYAADLVLKAKEQATDEDEEAFEEQETMTIPELNGSETFHTVAVSPKHLTYTCTRREN